MTPENAQRTKLGNVNKNITSKLSAFCENMEYLSHVLNNQQGKFNDNPPINYHGTTDFQ